VHGGPARVTYVEQQGMVAQLNNGDVSDLPPFAGWHEDPVEVDRTAVGSTFFMQVANVYGERIVGGFTDQNRAVWVYNGTGILLRENDPVTLPNGNIAYVSVPGTTGAELDGKQDAGFLTKTHIFYVVVNLKNSAGTPIGEALLRIPVCPVDLNCDGVLDNKDLNLFLQGFTDSEPWADFDRNGTLNINDMQAFLDAFQYAIDHGCFSGGGATDGSDGIE
jgi:hypothetical protein